MCYIQVHIVMEHVAEFLNQQDCDGSQKGNVW